MNNLQSLIKQRRSYRDYSQKPVPKQILSEIMDVTRYYASPSNSQNCRFKLISSHEQQDALKIAMENGKFFLLKKVKEKRSLRRIENYFKYSIRMFEAPILIAFGLTETEGMTNWLIDSGFYPSDKLDNNNLITLGLALQNLTLQVEQSGMHCCIYTAPLYYLQNHNLDELCFKLHGFIAIGYSDETIEPLLRITLNEFFGEI